MSTVENSKHLVYYHYFLLLFCSQSKDQSSKPFISRKSVIPLESSIGRGMESTENGVGNVYVNHHSTLVNITEITDQV